MGVVSHCVRATILLFTAMATPRFGNCSSSANWPMVCAAVSVSFSFTFTFIMLSSLFGYRIIVRSCAVGHKPYVENVHGEMLLKASSRHSALVGLWTDCWVCKKEKELKILPSRTGDIQFFSCSSVISVPCGSIVCIRFYGYNLSRFLSTP